MNLENQFVPYDLAVKLKNLGFDEPCLYYFNKQENNQLWQDLDSGYYRNSIVSIGNLLWGDTYDNGNVSAPLYQQAFDFFRKKYNIHSCIEEGYYGKMMNIPKNTECTTWGKITDTFNTYEEARLECLKKLIELCKKK